MPRHRSNDESPSYDSFLDIVANLVGILIILITVIGVRAKDAMIEAVVVKDEAVDVDSPRAAASAVERDINRIDDANKELAANIQLARRGRDKLYTIITAAKQGLEKRRANLTETDRQAYDLTTELAAARDQLHDVTARRQSIEAAAATPEVLRHLPTPMAKTVFGREEHFRLLDGRLTYIPWDDLVGRLKSEARQKVWKLKDAPRITETIGPVDGFRMRYTLHRTEVKTETRAGPLMQEVVELEKFLLFPVSDELGEPLEAALAEGSGFRRRLSRMDPQATTITVWVYPDSYRDFRRLKETLFAEGFLAAARPLPEGHPIGGSPHGSRSAGQ